MKCLKCPIFFLFLSPFISFYLFFLSLPYQQSTQTRTRISASRRSSLAYSSSLRVCFAASLCRGRGPWRLPSSARRPASASRRPRPHRRLIFNLRSSPVCPHRPPRTTAPRPLAPARGCPRAPQPLRLRASPAPLLGEALLPFSVDPAPVSRRCAAVALADAPGAKETHGRDGARYC